MSETVFLGVAILLGLGAVAMAWLYAEARLAGEYCHGCGREMTDERDCHLLWTRHGWEAYCDLCWRSREGGA
jgi:hypothetical protein